MLVLSRKKGQQLVIDGNIRVTVNRVSGNRVTLGIEAPDGVRVMRSEIIAIADSFHESDGAVSGDEHTATEASDDESAEFSGAEQAEVGLTASRGGGVPALAAWRQAAAK